MYVGREFAPVYPFIQLLDGFDYTNDLEVGDSIINATVNIFVEVGTDSNPSSRLAGGPIIIPNSNTVVQRVVGLLPGVQYCLQIVVNTTNGDTLSLYSRIQSRAIF